jgi:hypothetical protein
MYFNDRRRGVKVVPAGASSMKHGEKYNAFGMTDEAMGALDSSWKRERSTDANKKIVKNDSNKGGK